MADDIIHAFAGVPFTLTVKDFASAGYVWNLMAGQSPGIELMDDGLQNDSSKSSRAMMTQDQQMVGGAGERTLTFKVKKAGTHRLRLRLARPWLADADGTARSQDWFVHVAP